MDTDIYISIRVEQLGHLCSTTEFEVKGCLLYVRSDVAIFLEHIWRT